MASDKKAKRPAGIRADKVLEILAGLHAENKKIRETRRAMREGGAKPTSTLRTHSDFIAQLVEAGNYPNTQMAEAKWVRVQKQVEADGFVVKALPGVKKNRTAAIAAKYPGILKKKKA